MDLKAFRCALARLHPKELRRILPWRSSAAPNWVPRLCHAVSYDPGAVAELGVRPEASPGGWEAIRSYPSGTRGSHMSDKHDSACRTSTHRRLSPLSVSRHEADPATTKTWRATPGSRTSPRSPRTRSVSPSRARRHAGARHDARRGEPRHQVACRSARSPQASHDEPATDGSGGRRGPASSTASASGSGRTPSRKAAEAAGPPSSSRPGIGLPYGDSVGWSSSSTSRRSTVSRHHVLPAAGLLVHVLPLQPDHVGEQPLGEPVLAHHPRRPARVPSSVSSRCRSPSTVQQAVALHPGHGLARPWARSGAAARRSGHAAGRCPPRPARRWSGGTSRWCRSGRSPGHSVRIADGRGGAVAAPWHSGARCR